MRRQIPASELAEFFQSIGSAMWYIQHLENSLVQFLAVKIHHERRCAKRSASPEDFNLLVEQKRKKTLGPLLDECKARKIIGPDYQPRYDSFKDERHWLVHRSLVDIREDRCLDSTREAIFRRFAAIEAEARALSDMVFADMARWMAAHGVDVDSATKQGETRLRKLMGLNG